MAAHALMCLHTDSSGDWEALTQCTSLGMHTPQVSLSYSFLTGRKPYLTVPPLCSSMQPGMSCKGNLAGYTPVPACIVQTSHLQVL